MTDQNNCLSDIKFSKMSFPNILEYNFQKQIIVPEKQFRFLKFSVSFFFCSLPKSDSFCLMAVRLRVLVRALSSDLGAELKVFGRKIPPKHNSKKYKVGTNFIHSELGYRGIT